MQFDLVDEVVARLAEAPAVAPSILAGLQLGDDDPPKQRPAIIVFMLGDQASRSAFPRSGAFQRISVTLGLVHIVSCRNDRRRRGEAARDPMSALLQISRGRLNGWRPDGTPNTADVMALRQGRLLEVAEGVAIWQDEYDVSWRAAQWLGQSGSNWGV